MNTKPPHGRLDWHGFRTAAWIELALLAGATLLAAIYGDWYPEAFVFGLFLLLAGIFLQQNYRHAERLPSLMSFLFLLAALLGAAGWAWNLYHTVSFYDEVAHLFTTFTITLGIGYLAYYRLRVPFREQGMLYAITLACMGITIGVLWEVVEWASGIIGSISDTMVDLVMDAIGAFAAGVFALWALRRE